MAWWNIVYQAAAGAVSKAVSAVKTVVKSVVDTVKKSVSNVVKATTVVVNSVKKAVEDKVDVVKVTSKKVREAVEEVVKKKVQVKVDVVKRDVVAIPKEIPNAWNKFAYEVLRQEGGKFPRKLDHAEALAITKEAERLFMAQEVFTEVKYGSFIESVYLKKYPKVCPKGFVMAEDLTCVPESFYERKSEFMEVFDKLKDNVKAGAWLGALVNAVDLLDAKIVPADTPLIIGTAPLMLEGAGFYIDVSKVRPALFLKNPTRYVKWFNKLKDYDKIKVIKMFKALSGGKELVNHMLSAATKQASIGWLRKALPWAVSAITMMGTVTFISFLWEETLQSAGFSVWIPISNKQWGVADEALQRAKPLLASAEWWYRNVGWLAPYSFKVFKAYAEATRAQYESYQKVIDKKLGRFPDPSVGGRVFDTSEFKENVKTNTVPKVSKLVTPEIVEEEEEVEEKVEEEEEEVEEKVEVPKYTDEETWALKEAFVKIYELTSGANQMSMDEYTEMVAGFAMYTGSQREVLDKLFEDVWALTEGREIMSGAERDELYIKYGISKEEIEGAE